MARKKDKQTTPEPSPEDEAVWQRLTASTNPLPRDSRNRYVTQPQNGRSKTPARTEQNPSLPGKAAPVKAKTARPAGLKTPPSQPALMPRTRRRLARGTLPIEARLDLHGLTLIEAERQLARFVARAQGQNKIWLLVITGKGARGEGKLRRALPTWLNRDALAGQIVEYGPAAPNHGGDGAFYLRLRRPRK